MPATLLPAATLSSSAPDASESAMTTLYRAAIGPIHAERYLPRFRRFDTLGRTPPGWNWAASLCTLNWMALRHLWGPALVYVAAAEGLGLLVFGMGRNLLQWSDPVQWGLVTVFAALAFMLPGLYGDAVLYTEIRKRIARALEATHTFPDACAQLERQAATRPRLVGLVLLNLVLLATAVLAYRFLPQSSPTETVSAPIPITPMVMQPASAPASASHVLPPAAAASEEQQAAAPSTSSSHAAAGNALPASGAQAQQAPASSERMATAPPPPAPRTPASIAAPTATVLPSAPAPVAAKAPAPSKARAPEREPSAPKVRPKAVPAATPASPPSPAASAPDKAPSPAAAASNAAPTASAASTAIAPPAASDIAAAPAPAAASAASGSTPVVGSAPGYYINVGLFAEEANARKAQARLLNAGLPAFRQRIDSSGGQRFRVRVGPYPGLPQAQAAARSIRALQLEAVVFKQSGTNAHESSPQ